MYLWHHRPTYRGGLRSCLVDPHPWRLSDLTHLIDVVQYRHMSLSPRHVPLNLIPWRGELWSCHVGQHPRMPNACSVYRCVVTRPLATLVPCAMHAGTLRRKDMQACIYSSGSSLPVTPRWYTLLITGSLVQHQPSSKVIDCHNYHATPLQKLA
jgi:hypothetical protein